MENSRWNRRDPGFDIYNLYTYVNNNIYSHDNLGLYFIPEDISVCMVRMLPKKATQAQRNRYQKWKRTVNFQSLIDYIDDNICCYECISTLRILLHGNTEGTRATFSTTNIHSYDTNASIITEKMLKFCLKNL